MTSDHTPAEPGQPERTDDAIAAAQRLDQAERLAAVSEFGEPPKRRRRWTRVLGAGALLLLVVALVAPLLAGRALKPAIIDRLEQSLDATVRIESVSLNWFSGPRLNRLRIVDDQLQETSELTIVASKPLFALALNPKDLGTVTVTGRATLERRDDGSVWPFQKPTGEPPSPTKLPPSLGGTLALDSLTIDWVDPAHGAPVTTLREINASLTLKDRSVTGTLAAEIQRGTGVGSLAIDLNANTLLDSDGALSVETAKIVADATATANTELLHALGGDRLASLGGVSARLTGDTSASDGLITLSLDADNADAQLAARFIRASDGTYRVTLSDDNPTSLSATPTLVAAFAPELASITQRPIEITSGGTFFLDAAPSATLAIRRASVTIDPASPSLADARLDASLEIGQLAGTLDASPWRTEPLLVTASARRLDGGLDIDAVSTVQINGAPAGAVALDVNGLAVLDDRGIPHVDLAAMLASATGDLDVNDVSTAVVEPLLSPLLSRTGIVLGRDLGPVITATTQLGSIGTPVLRASIISDNLEASLGLRLEAGVLSSADAPTRLSMVSAAPLLTQLLAEAGVRVTEGAGLDARLTEFSLDLNELGSDGAPDLSSLSGLVRIDVEPASMELLAGGQPRLIAARATQLSLDLRNVRERAALSMSSAIDTEGRPAGNLSVTIDATDLLDSSGRLLPGVPTITGEIAVRDLRSDIIDPWLGDARVTARQLIGSSADLVIAGTGDEGVVTLDTRLTSGGLSGGGPLVIRDRVIATTDVPLTFTIENAGRLFERLTPGTIAPRSSGRAEVTVARLRAGQGEETAFEASLALTGIAADTASSRTIAFDRLNLVASLAGTTGQIEINGIGQIDEAPIVAGGRLGMSGLFDASGAFTPFRAQPVGQIDLTLPATAIEIASADPPPALTELLNVLVGSAIDVSLAAQDRGLLLSASGAAGNTQAEARLSIGDGAARFEGASVVVAVEPEDVRQLQLRRLTEQGDEFTPGIVLTAPSDIAIEVSGFDLARDDRLEISGSSRVEINASAALAGFPIGTTLNDDGTSTVVRSGEFGIEGLALSLDVPAGAIAGGESAALAGEISGSVVGAAGSEVTSITGRVNAQMEQGQLEGPVAVSVALPAIDNALVDDALRTDSFLTGALGASGGVAFELAGLAEHGRIADAGLTVTVDSPRLKTASPVAFDVRPDRLILADSARLSWTLDPVFITRHLLRQPAGEERVRLDQPVVASLDVDRLTLARGGSPFLPGVFEAHANVGAPQMLVSQQAETDLAPSQSQSQSQPQSTREWVQFDLSPIRGEITTVNPGSMQIRMTAAEGTDHGILAEASLQNLGNSRGVPTPQDATISCLIEAQQVPSMLIDAIAGLGGGMAEIIGPTTQLRLDATELSRTQGKINVSVVGERASSRIIGAIEGGVFRNDGPLSVELNVIRPQLGMRFASVVPVVGKVTKTRDDGPATVTLTEVSLPLQIDNPINGLDAQFVVDVGTARFQAGNAFNDLLKIAGQKTDTEVGRKLEPLVGRVEQGRMHYEELDIPLGEFTLGSHGSYHLVSRDIDVMTSIPLGALSDKAMGVLNTGLGSQFTRIIPGLEGLTMIPWRVTGRPGDLTVVPDLAQIRRNLTTLLNPVNVIESVFGGVRGVISGGG